MAFRVYGLDFTSVPSPRKPITKAECLFEKNCLSVRRIEPLSGFSEFEAFLDTEGEWIAGIDFPFGQPRKLIATNIESGPITGGRSMPKPLVMEHS